jgi:hypothetical protein
MERIPSRHWLWRAALIILALALLAPSVAGCGLGRDAARLERLIEVTRGVDYAFVNFWDDPFSGKGSSVHVRLVPAATSEEIAAIMQETAAGLTNERLTNAHVSVSFELPENSIENAESTFVARTSPSGVIPPADVLDKEVRAWAGLAATRPTRVTLVGIAAGDPNERSVTVEIAGGPPERIGDAFQELARQPFPPADAEWVVIPRAPGEVGESLYGVTRPISSYRFSGDLPADPILPVLEDVAGVAELAGPGDRVSRVAVDASLTHIDVEVDVDVADLRGVPCPEKSSRIQGGSADRLGQIYLERLEASGLSYELDAGVCAHPRFLEVSGGP